MTVIASAGRMLVEKAENAGFTAHLLFRTALTVVRVPRRLRFTLDNAYSAGVRALPVTMVVALFAGMILALQTGIELRRFGQTNIIGTVTALSMAREMGPFITGVILAATVGSAMAAELGTMNVSDETTALEVMSIDPVDFLVLPRVIALTLMCPILTAMSDLVGIAGGSIVGFTHLGVSNTYYWQSVQDALSSPTELLPKDVYVGLFKALVFGCTISVVACSAGLRASGGALGVGTAVRDAVRDSILLIIIFGYVITWFFYFLLENE